MQEPLPVQRRGEYVHTTPVTGVSLRCAESNHYSSSWFGDCEGFLVVHGSSGVSVTLVARLKWFDFEC